MYRIVPTIGDCVGLVGCSNTLDEMCSYQEEYVVKILSSLGLSVKVSPTLYKASSSQQRAQVLMDMYRSPQVKAIFDISGGDLALGVLEYLDYDVIRDNPKPLWGYSDLTCVINALYQMTGQPQVLYSMRNIFLDDTRLQEDEFRGAMEGDRQLFSPRWQMVQGTAMEGILVGGNIRCFLKLSGTKYMPTMENKVLFLESRSGDQNRIITMIEQLKLQGAFDRIKGLLLGTFTELDKRIGRSETISLIQKLVSKEGLPIAYTNDVGHGFDSKALKIGQEIRI